MKFALPEIKAENDRVCALFVVSVEELACERTDAEPGEEIGGDSLGCGGDGLTIVSDVVWGELRKGEDGGEHLRFITVGVVQLERRDFSRAESAGGVDPNQLIGILEGEFADQ